MAAMHFWPWVSAGTRDSHTAGSHGAHGDDQREVQLAGRSPSRQCLVLLRAGSGWCSRAPGELATGFPWCSRTPSPRPTSPTARCVIGALAPPFTGADPTGRTRDVCLLTTGGVISLRRRADAAWEAIWAPCACIRRTQRRTHAPSFPPRLGCRTRAPEQRRALMQRAMRHSGRPRRFRTR